MRLRHEESGMPSAPKRHIAIRAFAAAFLASSLIVGCRSQQESGLLKVECSKCTNCPVPTEATIMEKGSAVRSPGFISAVVTENEDGSMTAVVSGSVAQHSFSSESIDFEIQPGDICTVLLSGVEQLDIVRPASFFSDTKIAYPSSKRVGK